MKGKKRKMRPHKPFLPPLDERPRSEGVRPHLIHTLWLLLAIGVHWVPKREGKNDLIAPLLHHLILLLPVLLPPLIRIENTINRGAGDILRIIPYRVTV